MKYKAILFDLDGVIIDSEPIHMKALQTSLLSQGNTLTGAAYKQYFAGKTDEQGLGGYIEATGIELIIAELLQKKTDEYLRLAKEQLSAYPGVLELIQQLANQVPLALVTGSSREEVNFTLKSLGIDDCFDILVTANDVSEGKPSPDAYLQAAWLIGKEPEDCVIIEDSPIGVSAALQAEIECIAITNTHSKQELASADIVVDQLSLELFN